MVLYSKYAYGSQFSGKKTRRRNAQMGGTEKRTNQFTEGWDSHHMTDTQKFI